MDGLIHLLQVLSDSLVPASALCLVLCGEMLACNNINFDLMTCERHVKTY